MKELLLALALAASFSLVAHGQVEDCHGATRIDGTAAAIRIENYTPVGTQPHMNKLVRGQVGIVVVRNVVEASGKVSNLKVISGNPLLTGLVLDAMRQWEYRPFKRRVCFDLRIPVRNDQPTTVREIQAENGAGPL